MVSGKPCLTHHSRPGEMRSFTLSMFASVILSPGTTSGRAAGTSIIAVTTSAAASLRVVIGCPSWAGPAASCAAALFDVGRLPVPAFLFAATVNFLGTLVRVPALEGPGQSGHSV